MAELLGSAVLELVTDPTKLDAGLAAAEGKTIASTRRMEATVNRSAAAMGASMAKTGASLTRGLTVPILGVGAAAVKLGADFDAAMERVHTQSGETQRNVDMLRVKVLALAHVAPQGPTELANALYRLEGAGIRGTKALQALKAASDLAAVGNANVEDTAKTLGQAFFSGIKGLGSFKDVVAEMNATVGAGDLRLQQLVDALGTGVLPTASQVGLSFQDVTAALAVFGDMTNNVSGWAAQLATAFHFFTNPTTKAKNAFDELRLSQSQLANDFHKPHGLSVALTDLRDALDKLPGGAKGTKATQLLGDILPGGRGRVLLVLLNQLDRLDQKYNQIAKTTGNFGDAVAKTHQTAAYKIHTAWSSIEADLAEIGHAAGPAAVASLASFAHAVGAVAHAFGSLDGSTQKTIIESALVLAALGPLVGVAGKLTKGYAALALAETAAAGGAAAVGEAAVAAEVAATAAGAAVGTRFITAANAATTGGLGLARSVEGAVPAAEGEAAVAGASVGSRFGIKFVAAATAGIIGWDIGTALYHQVPAVRKAADAIAQTLTDALHPHIQISLDPSHPQFRIWFGGAKVNNSDANTKTDAQAIQNATPRQLKRIIDDIAAGNPSPMPKGGGDKTAYHSLANTIAAHYGLPAGLLWGVFGKETTYGVNDATSSAGAKGAFQFEPGTAKTYRYPMTNALNTGVFIKQADAAARYLRDLLKKFHGDVAKALNAYSGGDYKSVSGGGGGADGVNKDTSAGLLWAESMVGHFKESTGRNTGPELDKLEKEFGTHAAAWCAEFATKALVKAGFPKGVMTSSVASINAMAKAGAYGLGFTSSPSPGDLVTFGNRHVAIVEKVNRSKGTITAISGNSGGPGQGVLRRTYSLGAGRYISADAGGAGVGAGAYGRTPVERVPALKQSDIQGFLQGKLDHYDLMVAAGLLSQAAADKAKRAAIERILPYLRGDTKLQAIVTLRGIKKPDPGAPFRRALAIAYGQRNPGWVPPGGWQKLGIDPTRFGIYPATISDNPWIAASLQGVDNAVGSGAITEDQGNRSKAAVITRALPYLSGQPLADAKTQLKTLTDAIDANTKAQIENNAQLAEGAGGIGKSIVSLLAQPGGKGLLASLVGQGVDQIPGGLSISGLLAASNPGASLTDFLKNTVVPSEIAQFSAPGLNDQDRQGIWGEILATLSDIAGSDSQIADNTQAQLDLQAEAARLWKLRYQVSQAQYRTLPPFGGSFADGGIVPGPSGAARMVLAHGGERIEKIGSDGPRVRVVMEDNRTRVMVDDVEQIVQQVNRRTARAASRGLVGRGGGRG